MSDVPAHIGFILDGNRRWAKAYGLPAYEGHLAGYRALQEVVSTAFDEGVTYVSAYSFSTENWKRSQDEVSKLMKLAMKLFTADLKLFQDNNIRIKVLGSRAHIDEKLLTAIDEAEQKTAGNTRGTFALCFNYGGHDEIVSAVQDIVRLGIPAEKINENTIAEHLFAPEVPPCDIIVRTSGEKRLSNYMLWRSAYSELVFLDKNWPDMTKTDVIDILETYKQRQRRFGR
ncbi:MAG TPA: polyprenyl diphosphate synthase [Candidatus Saccharimonadales bacterium]